VTRTWVAKTLITVWSTILRKSSSVNTRRICRPTVALYVVCVLLVSVLSVLCPVPLRLPLRLTRCLRVSTFTLRLLVPVSKSCAAICSAPLWIQLRRYYVTPRLTRATLTRLFWLEVLLVFQRFKSWSLTSSTARSQTRASTRMRLLLTVPLFRPPF